MTTIGRLDAVKQNSFQVHSIDDKSYVSRDGKHGSDTSFLLSRLSHVRR